MNIIPRMKSTAFSAEKCLIHGMPHIRDDDSPEAKAAAKLLTCLLRESGLFSDGFTGREAVPVTFSCRSVSDKPEYYKLTVAGDRITALFGDKGGGRNAAVTIFGLITAENEILSVPCGEYEDWPDSGYRALLLDPARKYIPLPEMKATVRRMAVAKMNRLHLHLFDSGGYAVTSEVCPELNRGPLMRYTHQEIREIVEYCELYGVEIIPEIEMPAHSEFLASTYNELCCDTGREDTSRWTVCIGNPRTYEILHLILKEIAELIPSRYINILADELEFSDLPELRYWPEWENCSRCRELAEKEGLEGRREMFYHFIRKADSMVKSLGRKTLMGNDGIDISKSPALPRDILIQFWRVAHPMRGPSEGCSMERFLEEGFSVVNSFYPETYIDLYIEEQNLVTWWPTRRPESDPKYHSRILGGMMCAWEGKAHFEYSLPIGIPMFAGQLWNHEELNVDEEFQRTLTRHLLGPLTPEDLNIPRLLGGCFMPLDSERKGFPDRVTLNHAEFEAGLALLRAIQSLPGIAGSTAAIYTDCALWVKENREKELLA